MSGVLRSSFHISMRFLSKSARSEAADRKVVLRRDSDENPYPPSLLSSLVGQTSSCSAVEEALFIR